MLKLDLVHNDHFNLCGQIDNYKWILCSRKTGVKFEISDVQIYIYTYLVNKILHILYLIYLLRQTPLFVIL